MSRLFSTKHFHIVNIHKLCILLYEIKVIRSYNDINSDLCILYTREQYFIKIPIRTIILFYNPIESTFLT